MNRRIYRSTRNKVFGGVCAGLAEYTNVDTWLMRLLAVVAIFAIDIIPGLIAYGVSCLIIPTDVELLKDPMYNPNNFTENPSNPEKTRMVIGITLILIGVITLVKLLFGWIDFRYMFPVILVVFGAYLIYKNRRQHE